MKLNQEKLEEDIRSNLDGTFFKKGAYNNNTSNYKRRSFNDLFNYYRRRGVTEVMLMKAIVNVKLTAMFCVTPRRYVFCRYAWAGHWNNGNSWGGKPSRTDNCGKYNKEYLDALCEKALKS